MKKVAQFLILLIREHCKKNIIIDIKSYFLCRDDGTNGMVMPYSTEIKI